MKHLLHFLEAVMVLSVVSWLLPQRWFLWMARNLRTWIRWRIGRRLPVPVFYFDANDIDGKQNKTMKDGDPVYRWHNQGSLGDAVSGGKDGPPVFRDWSSKPDGEGML